MPLLFVHGTVDGTVPYEGKEGRYPGVIETSTRFAKRAGCAGDREELGRADFLASLPGEETKRERYTGCPAGNAVELWSMEGEGHAPTFEASWTQATLDWLEAHAP